MSQTPVDVEGLFANAAPDDGSSRRDCGGRIALADPSAPPKTREDAQRIINSRDDLESAFEAG